MMKTKRWQLASLLTLALMALFHAAAFADEASEAAGENKETMWDLITNGGLIMIPLALASLLALALGLERFIMLNKARILPATFVDGLAASLEEDPSGAKALEFCEDSDCAMSHVFAAGAARTDLGYEAVEKAIEDVGSREADKLKRSLRPLSVIATVCPLLGLLGTVYGMINAFGETARSGGTAKTAQLAEGIYEALVTTATGLTIAIPVLLLYLFLQGRADKVLDAVDEAGSDFVFSCSKNEAPPAPGRKKPAKKVRA